MSMCENIHLAVQSESFLCVSGLYCFGFTAYNFIQDNLERCGELYPTLDPPRGGVLLHHMPRALLEVSLLGLEAQSSALPDASLNGMVPPTLSAGVRVDFGVDARQTPITSTSLGRCLCSGLGFGLLMLFSVFLVSLLCFLLLGALVCDLIILVVKFFTGSSLLRTA